ncbi:MAG: alpha/beta fold hydrolase [Solirubrobacteraceae bacterium]
MFRRLLLALAAVAVLALPAAAPAKPTIPKGPSGTAFYAPPSPVPGKKHGDIIRAHRITGQPAVEGAARTDLVLYRSTGVTGKPVAVSGTVSIPTGKAPKSGWPVISYAHGTTGVADQCAPSRDAAGTSVHGYNSYIYPLLTRWLKARYAVVRTDYEGLGPPGAHPYLVGKSEGRSTLDIVRAARQLDPRIGSRLILAGHSQGGHAALWAASLAKGYTPDLRLKGTIAFAPASHIADQSKLLTALKDPGGGLTAFAATIIRGIDVGRPGLGLEGVLSDSAKALYPQTLTACLGDLAKPDSFGGQSPASLIRDGADIDPLIAALGQNDPEHLKLSTPVRVEQGTSDTTVFPSFTDQLVKEYQANKVPVTYKTYKGITHGGVVTAAANDSLSYIRQRLR